MTSDSTSTIPKSNGLPIRVLCKGCRSIQPIESFLVPVEAGCYRVRQQCWPCILKSNKHYRAHREDLRSARQLLEREVERVTCACGVSINVCYREKHEKTKRHQTVTALLRHENKPIPGATLSASIDAAEDPNEDELYAVDHKGKRRCTREEATTTVAELLDICGDAILTTAKDIIDSDLTVVEATQQARRVTFERCRRPSLPNLKAAASSL
jgi:hypothetical protein